MLTVTQMIVPGLSVLRREACEAVSGAVARRDTNLGLSIYVSARRSRNQEISPDLTYPI